MEISIAKQQEEELSKISLRFKSFLAVCYNQNFRYFPVWFVSIAGLSFSLIMTVFMARWEQSRIQEQFDRRADNLTFALQRNLDDVSQVARSLSGFYKASDLVNSDEFREFSLQILKNTPGVLRVGYAPKISQAEREIYEQEQGIKLWQGLNRKKREIAPKMPVYFPSTYLEPNDSLQQSYLGYNHLAEWQKKAAIEKARDTSVLAIAPSFLSNFSTHKEFIIYVPVYDRTGSLASRAERKKSFSGVAYAVFQVEHIVRTALKRLNSNGWNLYLYEMPVDRLESALNKSLNSPKEHFLIAYSADREKFIQDAESANVEHLLADSPNHRHCPYSQDWAVCIRTVNLNETCRYS